MRSSQEPEILLAEESDLKAQYTTDQEKQVAQWVLTNNKRAGAGTETFSDARCTYLSVRAGEHIYGVVGVAAAGKGLETSENSILLSVLEECALAMENQRHLEEKEAAAVLAKNEQLRANLRAPSPMTCVLRSPPFLGTPAIFSPTEICLMLRPDSRCIQISMTTQYG